MSTHRPEVYAQSETARCGAGLCVTIAEAIVDGRLEVAHAELDALRRLIGEDRAARALKEGGRIGCIVHRRAKPLGRSSCFDDCEAAREMIRSLHKLRWRLA